MKTTKTTSTKQAEKHQAQKELATKLQNQFMEDVKHYTDEPMETLKLISYFNRMSHKYSFKNQMLLFEQGALVVNSYKQWQEKGLQVKKGAKALVIWMPSVSTKFIDKQGKTKSLRYATNEEKTLVKQGKLESYSSTFFYPQRRVFDVNQTNVKPEDLPDLYPNKHINFDGLTDQELSHKVSQLTTVLDRLGVKYDLQPKDYDGDFAKGYYKPNDKVLVLNPDNTKSEKVETLVHEIAHAILHSKDENVISKELKLKRNKLDKQVSYQIGELQAELTAYMLADAIGLDTNQYSVSYVASWTNNGDLLKRLETKEKADVLEDVTKTANYLIDLLQDQTDNDNQIA